MPIEERLDVAMTTSCTMKSVVRHHLHTKTGSGYDRTFPDCMMTFVFGWGKTDIQEEYRRQEMEKMSHKDKCELQDDPRKSIADYQYIVGGTFQSHQQRDANARNVRFGLPQSIAGLYPKQRSPTGTELHPIQGT